MTAPEPFGRVQRHFATALLGGAVLAAGVSGAAEPGATSGGLRQLSLEELLNLDVSTASKKEEPLSVTAAAVSVVTDEDVRRSGATDLPEFLRSIPGVQVARINAHRWAVSVRGFNSDFANKLLVMIDGRSVYTPLFSGTLWRNLDLVTEDLDRIEVVRGPGGGVWGANAVNGVINIINKSAKETQGGLVSAGGGDYDHFIAVARQGVQLSDDKWMRVSGKFRHHGESEAVGGGDAGDSYTSGLGGVRFDWEPSDSTALMMDAGVYAGDYRETVNRLDLSVPAFVSEPGFARDAGAHVLGRWNQQVNEVSSVELQTFFDYQEVDTPYFDEQRLKFDVEFDHYWNPVERHELNWGVGYRMSADWIDAPTESLTFADDHRNDGVLSAFGQETYHVVPEKLSLTASVRLEHNDYTGFEVQPGLRALYRPSEKHSLWVAGSRAVRTPSRAESDARLALEVLPPGAVHPTLPALVVANGSTAFESEELWAFDAGYRWQPLETLHFDLAGYFNVYEKLRGTAVGTAFPNDPLNPTYVVLPLEITNDARGNTWGAEFAGAWQATPEWRLRLVYSYFANNFDDNDPVVSYDSASPENQLSLQSRLNLPGNVEVDGALRYVDSLKGAAIPSYFTADLRVGWRPRENLEFSVVGANLLDSPHQELRSSLIFYSPTLVSRSVFAKMSWEF